jgi:hypothetical protein
MEFAMADNSLSHAKKSSVGRSLPAIWAAIAMVTFAIVQTVRIGVYELRIPLIITTLLIGACAYLTVRAYRDWMARQVHGCDV